MSDRKAFSVAVYARRGDRILVIQHKRLQKWLPIGGELEANETPLDAAVRELREETGMVGTFPTLDGALDGVPAGLLGYEEHMAGSKGMHMNFVFVCDIPAGEDVKPNDEFDHFTWIDRAELEQLESPLNVRQFGFLALDAKPASSR